jgi:hypothetical protein
VGRSNVCKIMKCVGDAFYLLAGACKVGNTGDRIIETLYLIHFLHKFVGNMLGIGIDHLFIYSIDFYKVKRHI